MDITQLSDTELKALAYDQFATIEVAQKNVQAINAELAKRAQSKQQPVPPNTELCK